MSVSRLSVVLFAAAAACEPAPSDLTLGCDQPATADDYAAVQRAIDALDEGTDPTVSFCAGTHAAGALTSPRDLTVEALGDVVIDGDSTWTAPGLVFSGIEVTGELHLAGSDLTVLDASATRIGRTLPEGQVYAGTIVLDGVTAGAIDFDPSNALTLTDTHASSLDAAGFALDVEDSAIDEGASIFGVDVRVADSVLHGGLMASGATLDITGSAIYGTRSMGAFLGAKDLVIRDSTLTGRGAGSLVTLLGVQEATIALDGVTFRSEGAAQDVTVYISEELVSQTLTVSGTDWGGSDAQFQYSDGPVDLAEPLSDFVCTTGPSAATLDCATVAP